MPPQPPALNQMAQNDNDRSEMCGETCVASVMQALGFRLTPEDVIGWLRAHYGEAWVVHGTGGENPDHLVAFMVSQGVPAHVVREPDSQYMIEALAQDKYFLAAIDSDPGGNPRPGNIGHWILGYALHQYMNPYGGRYVTYPDLSPEDQRYGIVVDYGVPSPTGTGGNLVGWMDAGPANQPGWNTARRIKIHEWCHQPGVTKPANWPAEAAMDVLLAAWTAKGAEEVFGMLFGA